MKKKNSYFILIFLLFLFSIFLYMVYKPYNYIKIYTINDYKITEIYNKDKKYYTFLINDYTFLVEGNYHHERKLVNEIEDNNNCILPKSEYLTFYPLCNNDNTITTYNLGNDNTLYSYKEINNLNDKYNNISINYLNNKKILLYNYKGFYNIGNKKDIKLFNKDIYNIELVYTINNYLIIPNYNEEHYFSEFYLININNSKIEEIKLDNKISFNSVFLGDYKNNIYLLDKKEEKEYIINIKKKEVKETDFYILENNKLVKKNYLNIVNNSLFFSKDSIYKYEIIDNNIYEIIDSNKIKLSNLEVSKIIKIDNDTVYYLSNDKLYMYNNIYGEVLLLTNFEWNFNNTNMIFIF